MVVREGCHVAPSCTDTKGVGSGSISYIAIATIVVRYAVAVKTIFAAASHWVAALVVVKLHGASIPVRIVSVALRAGSIYVVNKASSAVAIRDCARARAIFVSARRRTNGTTTPSGVAGARSRTFKHIRPPFRKAVKV